MRAWTVLLLLLAGCAASPSDPGPTSPLHTGGPVLDENGDPIQVRHVPMDPVEGEVSAEGTVQRHCSVIGGWGQILPRWTQWTFDVGSNATTLRFEADWTPTTPTIERLGFRLSHADSVLATLEGAPGIRADVGVGDLDPQDRRITVRIDDPQCGGDPVAIKHYGGVKARLAVAFAA